MLVGSSWHSTGTTGRRDRPLGTSRRAGRQRDRPRAHPGPATVAGVNLTWLGLGSLAGVILWFATDHVVLLVLGVLMGVALGIGLADRDGPEPPER